MTLDNSIQTLENMAEQDHKRDAMSTEAGHEMLRLVTKASKRLAEATAIANTIGLGGTEIGDLAYSVENLRHQLSYDALYQCLDNLFDLAATLKAEVHMPRIGCGLAGGRWDRIEPLIQENLCVTVYDLGQ